MSSIKLPVHLFIYSGLFGATLYQSFFSGIVAYKALPIEMFSRLQHRVFPVYFTIQTVLSALLLVTAPQKLTRVGLGSLSGSLVSAVFNLAVVMPKSHTIISAREVLMEKEGKSYKDPTASDEMKALNKRFARLHGISMVANFILIGSIFTYGYSFSKSLAVVSAAAK